MKHSHPLAGTITALAKKVGCTRQHLSSVLSGRLKASAVLAQAIHAATKGAISKGSLRPDLWKERAKKPLF